jgi:hypothetical protein
VATSHIAKYLLFGTLITDQVPPEYKLYNALVASYLTGYGVEESLTH